MALKGKTSLTFHSGVLTIGGTVIEVAYEDSHIFFDFGTEFRPELDLPDDNLQTLIDNRLVPELKNVYDPRLSYTYHGDEKKEFAHTAAFLSHAHLDHSRMINYLDPKIPLYTLKETAAIVKELHRNNDFLISAPFEKPGFVREIIGLNPHDIIKVGDITIEILRVDHDAYGASALLITTPDTNIAYTGDLRLHGYTPEDTLEFCRRARHTNCLIMEGVSISFPEREAVPGELEISSEQDLIAQMKKMVLANPDRQITFNGYPANVQRFAQIVKEMPRQVVLEANMAALLKEIFDQTMPYYYANPKQVKIATLDSANELAYETLLNDSSTYLWQVVDHFENLQRGSLYFHSDAQPLGDYDPHYQPFLDLLADRDIEFVRLANSGHAIPSDLNKIVALIEPKLLVPIHSYHPELLENPFGERILPFRGEKIILEGELK